MRYLRRRQFLRAALGGCFTAALAPACGDGESDAIDAGASPGVQTTPEPGRSPSPAPAATLDEKIGQMIMVGFRGLTLGPDEPVHAALRAGRVGNVVLFDYDVPGDTTRRNIESPAQVAALDASIQRLAARRVLIASDQEGGYVARLKPKWGFPATSSAQALGALNDLAATRDRSRQMASTLKQAGVNLNLAPVVDLNTNPQNPVIGAYERSFSADPDVVTRQALAFIGAHHESGVLCTLKHFPGHGSSRADSHLGFVDVSETWAPVELEPYRNIIAAGKADAIMTAHVFNAGLDSDLPATLSKRVITGVLRDQLGYDGVVVTDDMQMGAIANYYAFDAAIEAAINAGADMIAIANNSVYDPAIGDKTHAAIKRAVDAKRIPESRIDEAYRRIVTLKARLA